MVTAITLIFFALLGIAFAISALSGRAALPDFGDKAGEAIA